MRKKCSAKTKSGAPCQAWAMPNGFCSNHGGEFISPKTSPEVEKEETKRGKCFARDAIEGFLSTWLLLTISLFTAVGEVMRDLICPKEEKAGEKN
jgi:hypothetical protein